MDDKKFSQSSHSVRVHETNGVDLIQKEVYRPILEEQNHNHQQTNNQEVINSSSDPEAKEATSENGKMVQDAVVNDGADEQMLGVDNEKLTEKRDEVKFIKGDHQNGDAKIDIGMLNAKDNGATFTGMSKEELMKYANDPFWIRLRWIFFVAFWAIWAGMLIGAILIIVDAPKCAAPEPLAWYKRGLLAKFSELKVNANDVAGAQKLQASGAIYELPAELTYAVKDPEVEKQIKSIVASYEKSDVNVILDITPNYVTKDSPLLREALADQTKRSAFIWIEKPQVPNNWLSMVNGSAWSEVQPGHFVLSQFGDGLFDLKMNDTIVRRELEGVLRHLVNLGVKGIRFRNSKFFLVSAKIEDEVPSNDPSFMHTQYGFWTHKQTTFQEGLGELLFEYTAIVKNASANAFLAVADDVGRPEVYKTSVGANAVDMPLYGHFTHSLSMPEGKYLRHELSSTLDTIGNHTWLQWNFADVDANSPVDPSALMLFLSLLPGVPVVPVDATGYRNVSEATFKDIEQLRTSPSYMHGGLELYDSNELLAYSRIKSGNPGFFVAFNPTGSTQKGNFTNTGLPEKMSADVLSENYNITGVVSKAHVMTDAIEVSPYATLVLTYVPVKSG